MIIKEFLTFSFFSLSFGFGLSVFWLFLFMGCLSAIELMCVCEIALRRGRNETQSYEKFIKQIGFKKKNETILHRLYALYQVLRPRWSNPIFSLLAQLPIFIRLSTLQKETIDVVRGIPGSRSNYIYPLYTDFQNDIMLLYSFIWIFVFCFMLFPVLVLLLCCAFYVTTQLVEYYSKM